MKISPDAPHGYRPQRVTADRLLRAGHSSDFYYWKDRLRYERPCATCGGSELTMPHLLNTPKRRVSLASALAAIDAANAAA